MWKKEKDAKGMSTEASGECRTDLVGGNFGFLWRAGKVLSSLLSKFCHYWSMIVVDLVDSHFHDWSIVSQLMHFYVRLLSVFPGFSNLL